MDEPLSNLDAKLRVEMRAAVSRLQHRLGTTTVYVTHDQTEAMTLGDRVAVMRSGILQQFDTPRELYNNPKNLFVAGFIGSPSMNFFGGHLEGDRVRTPLGDLPLDDALRRRLQRHEAGSKEVVVGIRPEEFEDAALVTRRPQGGATSRPPIEIVESMGSEIYAYFGYEGGDIEAAELAGARGRLGRRRGPRHAGGLARRRAAGRHERRAAAARRPRSGSTRARCTCSTRTRARR